MFRLFSKANTNKDRNTFLVMLIAGALVLMVGLVFLKFGADLFA